MVEYSLMEQITLYGLLPLAGIGIGWLVWRHIYKKIVRPIKYYKLTVFSDTDEFTFYEKKKDAVIFKGKTGYNLDFGTPDKDGKTLKEFYCVASDDKNAYSKRDDDGMTSFYFLRNNANPLNIRLGQVIEEDADASLLWQVLETNLLKSALLEEEPANKGVPMWVWIVLGLIVIAIVLFGDKIKVALGV